MTDNQHLEEALLDALGGRAGAVLLVGAWSSATVSKVAKRSRELSIIALTEPDATRLRNLAATKKLPMHIYLPSAALDPRVDRRPHTATVRWTPELFHPVPALTRIAVAGFADQESAAALRAFLPADTIVVIAEGSMPRIEVEPIRPGATVPAVLDELEAVDQAAFRPKASTELRALGVDLEALLASRDPAQTVAQLAPNTVLDLLTALAPVPILRPRPGWHFDQGFADPPPLVRLRRDLWEWMAASSPEVVLRLPWFGGTKLTTSIGTDLCRQLFVTGQYEPNELFAFAAGLTRSSTAIDAGAHIGVFSLLAARRVGNAGRVVAIEPSQRERRSLSENIATNGFQQIHVEPVALLDQAGEANFQIAALPNTGHNTLGKFAYHNVEATATTAVQTERLDDLVERLGLRRVDVLKLDVEGAEHRVLLGSGRVLREMQPLVLMELSNASLGHMGSTRHDVINELHSYGYQVRDIDCETGLIGKLSSDDDAISLNVVAGPDGRFPPILLE